MAQSMRDDGRPLNEIDLINQKVATAMRVPAMFLYPDADKELADRRNVEEFIQLQQVNDLRSVKEHRHCNECRGDLPPRTPVPLKDILGKKYMEEMSKSWSNELRRKVE